MEVPTILIGLSPDWTAVPRRVKSPVPSAMPKMRLSRHESRRLAEILRQSPGPSPWYSVGFPRIAGPAGVKLRWLEVRAPTWATVLVPEGQEEPVYGALGFYCYVWGLAPHRMLVWDHVGEQLSPRAVRISLLDTSLFEPLDTIPDLGSESETHVAFEGHPVSVIDVPTTLGTGIHSVVFPEGLRELPEILVLVHASPPDRKPARGQSWVESLYVLKPSQNALRVLPLDWWNSGDFDFGYEWIAQIAHDPVTDNFVGDGFRILPFLMDRRAKFIGWFEPAK